MKSNQTYLSLIALLSLFAVQGLSGCGNESAEKTTATVESAETPVPVTNTVFSQLVGTWQSEDGKSFERWTKNDNGTFSSVGFSIKGTDTSWNEHASIFPENEKWVFENTVKDQNDGKAIRFTSSLLTASSVQFSNPAHDFPTDINYTIKDANTVNAFIVGPNSKGGKDTIPFNFTRVK